MEQCLCSVVKACNNIQTEIWVVDNNSTDGSKDFFSNRFPQVQFIWKQENVGFAKANNEALKLAKGEKILFLNPDTILPEDCLQKCLQFFDQQKNTGALGVTMIDGSGNFLPESKRGFPSAFASFCKMTGLTKLFAHPSCFGAKIFGRYYLAHLPKDQTNEVDVLSGAFMMVDKKVLNRVGGFDEDYFMYAEDIDLSYRIQKAGYHNIYFSGTSIVHFKGESTVKQHPEYIRNFYGTMILFVKKHYSGVSKIGYVWLLKILVAVKSMFAGRAKQQAHPMQKRKAFVLIDEAGLKKNGAMYRKYFESPERIDSITQSPAGSILLCCEPFLSFKEMILLMQQYRNQYEFFIHAATTGSMVGSRHKNTPGIASAL